MDFSKILHQPDKLINKQPTNQDQHDTPKERLINIENKNTRLLKTATDSSKSTSSKNDEISSPKVEEMDYEDIHERPTSQNMRRDLSSKADRDELKRQKLDNFSPKEQIIQKKQYCEQTIQELTQLVASFSDGSITNENREAYIQVHKRIPDLQNALQNLHTLATSLFSEKEEVLKNIQETIKYYQQDKEKKLEIINSSSNEKNKLLQKISSDQKQIKQYESKPNKGSLFDILNLSDKSDIENTISINKQIVNKINNEVNKAHNRIKELDTLLTSSKLQELEFKKEFKKEFKTLEEIIESCTKLIPKWEHWKDFIQETLERDNQTHFQEEIEDKPLNLWEINELMKDVQQSLELSEEQVDISVIEKFTNLRDILEKPNRESQEIATTFQLLYPDLSETEQADLALIEQQTIANTYNNYKQEIQKAFDKLKEVFTQSENNPVQELDWDQLKIDVSHRFKHIEKLIINAKEIRDGISNDYIQKQFTEEINEKQKDFEVYENDFTTYGEYSDPDVVADGYTVRKQIEYLSEDLDTLNASLNRVIKEFGMSFPQSAPALDSTIDQPQIFEMTPTEQFKLSNNKRGTKKTKQELISDTVSDDYQSRIDKITDEALRNKLKGTQESIRRITRFYENPTHSQLRQLGGGINEGYLEETHRTQNLIENILSNHNREKAIKQLTDAYKRLEQIENITKVGKPGESSTIGKGKRREIVIEKSKSWPYTYSDSDSDSEL